jgi:hypothetical protein
LRFGNRRSLLAVRKAVIISAANSEGQIPNDADHSEKTTPYAILWVKTEFPQITCGIVDYHGARRMAKFCLALALFPI